MEKLYAPENLKKFSDCIVAAVNCQEDDRLFTLLNVLKVIVSGPPGEGCQSFYGSRVPADRCLAAVLSSPSVQSALAADPVKCKEVVDILLGLPYLTTRHCRALAFLLPCTPPSSELRRHLARTILGHHDLYKFELDAISAALKEDTTQLELSLIELCTQEPTEQILIRFNHWIKWCACSSDVFQNVTSILHELLKHLKCKTRVLGCIRLVVDHVRKSCERSGIDFVSLYPSEVGELVGLMLMAPSTADDEISRYVKTEVRAKLADLQRKDPSTALLLLTHFPDCDE